MEKRTNFAFVAIVLAILIPVGISIFLIKKSYELERRKFDIEVTQLAGNVFFSFKADYNLLDSLINYKVLSLPDSLREKGMYPGFKKGLPKVYESYNGIRDSLLNKFRNNNYMLNFEYSLEISELKIMHNNWQIVYISDSIGKHKPMVLFGYLSQENTAASYNFYHMSNNNYIRIQLNIDYPGKNGFIMKRIWPLIAGISISMLVLILILIYTVKVLLWQKKLSDMKSHFIDNITHEFNTPVSTLKLTAATIKQLNQNYNSKDLEKIGLRIHNQTSRLSGLIEKVMSLSLNQDGNINYDFKVVNLNSFIAEIVEKFKASKTNESLTLEMEFIAVKEEVRIDEYYLKIALFNILDNAQKYSKERAEIEVSTNNSNGAFWIEIKDKGIGIQRKHKKHIFKRFYRANNLKQYKAQGLGLGLSIVKQIIEAHKGKITVDSNMGLGTNFKIMLPLKKENA